MRIRILVAVLAIAATACSDRGGSDSKNDDLNDDTGGTPKATAPIAVSMTDNAFSPAKLTARTGDTVIVQLKNDGKRPHTFTLQDPVDVDTEVAPGNSDEVRFTATNPGEFEIVCRFHGAGGMTATLTVS